MRSLHVAALPFPAPRGTQAALDALLRALNGAGHPASLFCYPEHAAASGEAAYPVQRVARLRGPDTTASGPSWAKIKLDLGLLAQLAALVRREQPDVVVAHHVEAALCCLHLSRPVLFYAHTSLRTELPTYFSAALHRPLALAGEALDSFLCRRFADMRTRL